VHLIRGRPLLDVHADAWSSLDDALAMWKPMRDETALWVNTLMAGERRGRRTFPWAPAESATVEEIIWHVVTHEQYHRGQIFTRLALLGQRNLPVRDLLRQ
jgi:uncharacterized damage-inducible protein DinB